MNIFAAFGVLMQISSTLSTFQLSLLHINDIHVRMEETNKYSSRCKDKDQEEGNCYGGLSRVQTKVKELRNEDINTLWLNAGDFYQGTIWYTQFKWKVVSPFSNMLAFDAQTLGNHEFDDDIAGLVPFLKEQKAPTVVANINMSSVPEMIGLTVPSVIKIYDGKKVGIVGYLTPDTKQLSQTGDLIFIDEIEALKKEVAQLTADGVDIIIALGHSGYEKDIEIAREVPGIDVVVGGHTHSFLFTPSSKSANKETLQTIRGPYPTIVENKGGSQAIVVQAYAYTMYLGHLNLVFSDEGNLISWDGEPILLDNSVPKDNEVETALQPWKVELDRLTKIVIGAAAVDLEHTRDGESLMGNLVADIMVWAYRNKPLRRDYVRLAIANSGGIRTSLEKGNITLEDLMTTLPFHNTFDLVLVKGEVIRQMMEHSVYRMTGSGQDGMGRFLVFSGFKVVYDLRKQPGERVASVLVKGKAEEWEALDDGKTYPVVMTNYIIDGGDGYSMIEESKPEKYQGPLDTDVVKDYLKEYSPVSSSLEDRITIVTDDSSLDLNNSNTSKPSLLTSVIMSVMAFKIHLINAILG